MREDAMLFSDAEARENVGDDLTADCAAVDLSDLRESKLYIRGCRIGRDTEPVCSNGRLYRTESRAKRRMLACRGYDSVGRGADLFIGKQSLNRLGDQLKGALGVFL